MLPERDQGCDEAEVEMVVVVVVVMGRRCEAGGWFVAVCQRVIIAVHSARVSRGTLVSS